MEALQGLVELGLQVNVDTVSQAIGDVRSALILNYMRRLSSQKTPASAYIMRQAIRIVPSSSRLEILKSLVAAGEQTNGLYYAAAKLDPSETVQSWLNQEIQFRPISDSYLKEYQAIISDYLSGGKSEEEVVEPVVQELEVEELEDSELVKEVPSSKI